MKTQGLEFREALTMLADQAGVTLTHQSTGPKVDKTERESQLATMQSALIFFRNELKKNSNALTYLENRGLDQSVQNDWDLGYAPDVGEALAIHLSKDGKSLAMAEQLFLTQADRSGGYGDKFRGRVMFPIRNEKGDLIGFGGRILGQGNPKYINSSETPLYNKSHVLYGIHRAKDRMMKERHAVLVEGYLDVIACHRAGITEAVASCGTALAEGQVRLIKRFADKVTILYDGDAAGQKAAERAIEIFDLQNLPCKIALLPPGDDPDTLLKSKGADAIRDVISAAETPFDFRVRMLEVKHGTESDEFWQEIPKLLAQAPSELALEKHLIRLAGLHPFIKNPTAAARALKQDVRNAKRGKGKADQTNNHTRGVAFDTTVQSIEVAEGVLLRAVTEEEFRAKYWPMLSEPQLFTSSAAKRTIEALLEAFGTKPPTGPAREWFGRIESEYAVQLLTDVEFDFRFNSLTDAYISDSIEELRRQIKAREIHLEKENLPKDNDDALRSFIQRLRQQKGVDEEP